MPGGPRTRLGTGGVVCARKPFTIGPANDIIEPGDVLDLDDDGWELNPRTARNLIEHYWADPASPRAKVTRTPSVTPDPVLTDQGA